MSAREAVSLLLHSLSALPLLTVAASAQADHERVPLSALLEAATAEREEPTAHAHKTKRYRGFRILLENDTFLAATGKYSDRNYTNGVRAELFLNTGPDHGMPTGPLVTWVRRNNWENPVAKLLGLKEKTDFSAGVAFGQHMYTPQRLEEPRLIINDRPYAALLYGSHFAAFYDPDGRRTQSLELMLGWVGPEALGAEAQSGFHKLFNGVHPRGWRNQLKFEPIVNSSYRTTHRVPLSGRIDQDNVSMDLVPELGFDLGNLMIRGVAGVTLRVGQHVPGSPLRGSSETYAGSVPSNIPLTAKPDLPLKRLPDRPPAPDRPRRPFRWYLFGGVEGRLVAHNLLLDGNTFQTSHRIPKTPGVYDLRAGLAVSLGNVHAGYTLVRRSEEFRIRQRPGTPRIRQDQLFGGFAIAIDTKF